MAKFKIVVLLLVSGFFMRASAQSSTLDRSKVVKQNQIFILSSKSRGIEATDGRVYFVESNNRVVAAYENGQLRWRSDIIAKCGKPAVGKAEIRHIKIDGDKVFVNFGKSSSASINRADGKVTFLGTR